MPLFNDPIINQVSTPGFSQTGNFNITGAGLLGTATIYPNTNSTVSLIVKGDNNQTSNIQQWQDSSGSVLASIGNTVNTEGGRGFINVQNVSTDITGVGFKFTSGNTGQYTGLFQLDGGGSMVFRNSASGGVYFDGKGTSDINFRVTNSFTTILQLKNAGNVVIGAQAANATTATDGYMYIPTSAGAPTGVPTAFTGKVALQYDTTNNNLYVYNGAWKKVGLA